MSTDSSAPVGDTQHARRSEAEIQNGIFERYGREPDVTLWRNNTGVAKSEVVTRAHLERLVTLLSGQTVTGLRGQTSQGLHTKLAEARGLLLALLDEKPRFTPFGLCVGSSDIIGIVQNRTDALERPDHHLGITLALEVKVPGKNPSREQQLFLDLVNRRGGVGRCVHSENEAGAAIEEARRL